MTAERERVILRDESSNGLFNTKWSALNSYTYKKQQMDSAHYIYILMYLCICITILIKEKEAGIWNGVSEGLSGRFGGRKEEEVKDGLYFKSDVTQKSQ